MTRLGAFADGHAIIIGALHRCGIFRIFFIGVLIGAPVFVCRPAFRRHRAKNRLKAERQTKAPTVAMPR